MFEVLLYIAIVIFSYFFAKYMSRDRGYIMPIKHQDHTIRSTINHKPIYYQTNIEDIISGDAKSIIVAVDSPTKTNFTIRKKYWIEKIFLKDRGFNNSIYIGSDEPTLYKILENKILQNKILKLLNREWMYACKSIEIMNNEGMFYLQFNLKKGLKPKKIDIDLFIQDVIDELLSLETLFLLPSIDTQVEIKEYSKRYLLRFWLTFLGSSSFLYSIIILDDIGHYIIDDMKWFIYTISVVVVASIGIFIYILKKMQHSALKISSAKRYFIGSFLIGILLFSIIIQESNIYLDTSNTKSIVATIDKKEKSTRVVTYSFILKKNNIEGLDKVRVHGNLYRKKVQGDKVKVLVKEGFWGIRWVFDVE